MNVEIHVLGCADCTWPRSAISITSRGTLSGENADMDLSASMSRPHLVHRRPNLSADSRQHHSLITRHYSTAQPLGVDLVCFNG